MFGRLPDGWEAWLLVLFVPATIASIVRYVSFRLRYDDHELVIRSGLIFRNERHIPFSRIQNVDASPERVSPPVRRRRSARGNRRRQGRRSAVERAAAARRSTNCASAFSEALGTQNLSTRHPGTWPPKHPYAPYAPYARVTHPVLLHLPLRELLLFGFLENKGMVLIGAAMGIGWETGIFNRLSGLFFETAGCVAPQVLSQSGSGRSSMAAVAGRRHRDRHRRVRGVSGGRAHRLDALGAPAPL